MDRAMNTGISKDGSGNRLIIVPDEDEIPIDAPELEDPDPNDYAKTLVMRRVQLDSVSPAALPTIPPPAPAAPPQKRSTAFAFIAGIAVGVGGLLAAGTMMSRSAPPPAPAAQVAAQPPPVEAPPPATAESKPAAPAETAAPVEAPKKEAPAKPAPVPRAPIAAKAAPTAAPVSTADLPDEMPVIPPAPKPATVEIDRSAVAVAIASAGRRAASCADGESASGPVSVTVTFLSTGQAARALVNGPLAGTAVGSCIAAALKSASVPRFDGEAVNVSTTIRLQ